MLILGPERESEGRVKCHVADAGAAAAFPARVKEICGVCRWRRVGEERNRTTVLGRR